jgi:(p)ppGpp synthase/HD superfamily hydrolase
MNLETAINLAVEAHKGQKDKSGQPYIYHCYRVMSKVTTEEEKIVAILHDVLEDSNLTTIDLINYGFSYDVVNAVAQLTKVKEDSYEEYIKWIKCFELSKVVKIADLLDNINLSRLSSISVKDINRTRKYLDALEYLISEK